MALFKILSGNSSSFTTDLSSSNVTPPFNEGFCYFIKDTQKFYIDWKDSDGNMYRTALNENDLASKMDKKNPEGTGTFSMGRKKDSTVGSGSFAKGTNVTASGLYSFAQGQETTASGGASHTEGLNTIASGNCSHAEGEASTASGTGAHAEGAGTNATKQYSHAEGYYTETGDKYQHVEGKFNVVTTGAHIIGNGTSSTKRSNAYTLDWDGNAWFSGNVYVGSTSGTNKDNGSKMLATVDYDFDLITTSNIDTICTATLSAASEVSF